MINRSDYATCPVSGDVWRLGNEPDELSETGRARLVTDVSEALADARYWGAVSEHIGGDAATWHALSDALRRAALGGRCGADALGQIESLALAARDAVAGQIVTRFLRDHWHPSLRQPLPPAHLLAKYPTGNIPQTELLHAIQSEAA